MLQAVKMTEKWLRDYGQYIDQIGISCDSLSDITNKELGRGFGQHVKITEKALSRVHKINAEMGLTIRIKLNTVVMKQNMHEDWSDFIEKNRVQRWKVFKVLKIIGENEEHFDSLCISDTEFDSFVERHAHLAPILVFEDNDAMTNSYLMVTPDGRIYQNFLGRYEYSQSILQVGVSAALSEVGFDFSKFQRRGGVYQL